MNEYFDSRMTKYGEVKFGQDELGRFFVLGKHFIRYHKEREDAENDFLGKKVLIKA